MTPRPLTAADLDAIDALQPRDWPAYRATFERYFRLPCCTPFGIDSEGTLRAMGTLIQFGGSAWVAQLITHPDDQGRGLGTALLKFLTAEAGSRGITTLSLVATEQGYPLYLKNGFRVEGEYSFWTRPGPAPAEPSASAGLRPWSDPRGPLALDLLVSGESRGAYFEGRTDEGWTAPDPADGFYLPGIGEGLVAARTVTAGAALLHRRLDGAVRCVVPEENSEAAAILRERGFHEHHRARRMVLGPSLNRRPGWLWSRIGGNLG